MPKRSSAKEVFELRQDRSPVFRKAIFPWYDSDWFCIAAICLGLFAGLLGGVGWDVAGDVPAYRAHLWLPALLIGLSAALVVSTVVRILRRRRRDE
jgi:hypothetical protein